MSTVLVFESFSSGDAPREWSLKSVLSGPVNNGFLWNQIQPMLNQDLIEKGECASYILLVEDTVDVDNSRQTTCADEYKTQKATVKLVNHKGQVTGR